jgi:two-component system, NarL family, nitrate/nitrite response regulator NarL
MSRVKPMSRRRGHVAEKPTVVIASGVARMRERWCAALSDYANVVQASSRLGVEQVMVGETPGVIVVDLALPDLDRIGGLASIRKLNPAMRILALTEHETEAEGVDALIAGAKGYCLRTIDAPMLVKAVESVQNGELWVKRALVQALVAALMARAETEPKELGKKPDRRRLERLTLRQREVAEAIARGASNKEIANRLNVTERTVKAHITEMFRCVGVFDRLHLALFLNDIPGTVFELPPGQGAPPSSRRRVRAAEHRNGAARADSAQSD